MEARYTPDVPWTYRARLPFNTGLTLRSGDTLLRVAVPPNGTLDVTSPHSERYWVVERRTVPVTLLEVAARGVYVLEDLFGMGWGPLPGGG